MTTSGNGESVLDVLARMKNELAFDVDEMLQAGEVNPTQNQDVTRQAHATKTTASPVQLKEQTSHASPPAADRSPEESVAELGDYMGNLLNRYGQGSSALDPSATTGSAEPVHSSLPQRKPKPTPPKQTNAAEGNTGEQAAENEPSRNQELLERFCLLDQKEFIPRKRAPEEKACIDAMRELAVHSARKAIQACDNKRRGLDAKHRLALGFGAFAASGVAFFLADSLFSVFGALGMCGLAVGCMFIVNWQTTITLLKKSNNN